MKKLNTLLTFCFLSVILAFGLYPVNAVNAAAAGDFTDVGENYWGREFISFAAQSGIIKGYPVNDGTFQFRPENPVTKEESMQMIYQAVKNSGIRSVPEEDLTEKYMEQLTQNSIAAWAWECAAFGLENEILDGSELQDFRNDSNMPVSATREEVARWTAKAIGRDLMPATSLTYPDKDQLSEVNLVYADLLNRMSIMVGDNNGKFNPKSGIKRVEFAGICTRVYELADSKFDINRETESCQGTVTGVNAAAGKIYMTMPEGSAKVIDVSSKAEIVINGKAAYNNLSKVKIGEKSIISWSTLGQVHIDTGVKLGEGTVIQITPIDDTCDKLSVRIPGGSVVYYYISGETSVIDEPKKGKDIVFIADGIKILEIANQ